MSNKPLLLIDGDQYLYKATVAVEREVKWDDDNYVLGSNAEEAYDVCKSLLLRTFRDLGTGRCQIALTKGHNFRKDILSSYKGNRLNTRKPLCYLEVRERLEADYKCLSVDGLEADDIMGIWQTNGRLGDTIIVSEDKDMKTIPGKLYRQGELIEVSELEADYNHLFQTLLGDATDGYSGCPGVGAVGANKLLSGNPSWPTVVKAYEAKGLTEDDALTQARLARILRSSDWNSVSKTPILWSPPNAA